MRGRREGEREGEREEGPGKKKGHMHTESVRQQDMTFRFITTEE